MASVYSVAQVNSYIKNMFAQDFVMNRISVRGEISNCKYHPSGHIYFTMKDESGTLKAVMFAGQRRGLSFRLEEGQSVVVTGAVDVYERDGTYQLYAKKIELDGRGDLYERFCRLREELEEMGMFAEEYKRPIPRYAQKIGIVTASTGAAIRDIMNITARRNPFVQLILYPALVQGDGAVVSICAGIRTLDEMGLDVLIVGRGGGSIEDLWAFNEEDVARAIFECQTPVISAVGHETDVTIADFVADLRAPTPSAAAELAVFDWNRFVSDCQTYEKSLVRAMSQRIQYRRNYLSWCQTRLLVQDPHFKLSEKRRNLADMEGKLNTAMEKRLTEAKHHLALASGRLQGLSPLEKISKGFGFLTNQNEHRIESVSDVKVGDPITIRILDGRVKAVVTEISEAADVNDVREI